MTLSFVDGSFQASKSRPLLFICHYNLLHLTAAPQTAAVLLHRSIQLNSSEQTMGFGFDRPTGAGADASELEYVSALLQTDVFELRPDASIRGTYSRLF